jgi:hypothetical protein
VAALRKYWLAALLGVALIVALPVTADWLQPSSGPRCDLDGVAVDPAYQVRIMDGEGRERRFCCIRCAELWLKHQGHAPREIWVTDEVSGQEIDARSAWFTRSLVITNPVTGNRIHAFRSRPDAEKHVQTSGTLLVDGETPFAGSRLADQ